jgi:serine protease Do
VLAQPSPALALAANGVSIADVAAKVTPSVVNVFSERVQAQAEGPQAFADPMFRFFFRGPGAGPDLEPRERKERGLGSGVIVGSDGLIITNNHVVAEATKIRVALNDRREFDAKLVGADPKSDVAVLRIDAKDLPAIPLGDSAQIRIGDLVLAIGNPFGIGQTVTMGIVSAVGRANMGITDYEDFIQTDAAINPGNSGGALVTLDGRLVGINTAIASRSGGYQGIGFAIPSNMVLQIKDSIVTHGRVVRGWLGVAIQDIGEDLAQGLGVPPRSGVLVGDVTPDSPASRAGLERGDVITAIDGKRTSDSAQLRNLVALAGKERKVKVDVLRGGQERSFEVTLGEAPAERAAPGLGAPGATPDAEPAGALAGMRVQELDAAVRSQLRLPPAMQGVVITGLAPRSPAAVAGLRPGDVILEVNRNPTPSVSRFQQLTQKLGERALLLVYREGSTLFVALNSQ